MTAEDERQDASETSRGIRHAGTSFASTLLIGLVSAVVISRLFGVEVIGAYALASAPAAVLPMLSTLGEQTALVRSTSHEKGSSTRAVSLFAVVLAFSAVLTLAAAAVVALIAVALLRGPVDQPDLVAPALVLVAGYVLFGNVSWNVDKMLSVFRGTQYLLYARLFDVGFLLVASIAAGVVFGADIWSLVWATVGTLVPAMLLRLSFLRRLVTGRPTRLGLRTAAGELPDLIRFGVRTVPGTAAGAVASHAGTWLLGAVTTVAALGAYARANNLASRVTDAGFRLSEVLLPVLSHAVHERRYADAGDAFARWRTLVTVALVGACASLSGPAEGLLAIFGPGFSEAWVVMGLLLFAYSAAVVNIMHADLLVALGHPVAASTLALVRCGVTLVLLVPLTLSQGIEGTALAIFLAYALELACLVLLADRRLARHDVRAARVPWGSLAVAAGLAMLVGRLLDELSDALVVAVLASLVGGAVYLAVALLTRAVDLALVRSVLATRLRA